MQLTPDDDLPREERPVATGCGWPTAVAVIALAALAALLIVYVWHGAFSGPSALAQDLRDSAAKLGNLFGTDVKVDSRSVTLESREIMELATVQHRVVCVTKYTTRWAGSTATLIVRGVYTAKAGFALEKGTTFRLDEHGQVLDGSVPPARVLSVTTDEQKVFFDAQGILKTLEAQDYEEAFRQNRAQAQHEAEEMGMREEARTRLKERLADMLPSRREEAALPRPTPALP